MKDIQNSEKRFVYFYFNRNEPEEIKQVVPDHVQYWKTANPKGYSGGPFGDRTGGMITFLVPNLQAAMEFILRDPFIREDLIEEKWVKEWIPE